MKQSPVLITGVERSGAGLIARIVDRMGGFGGTCSRMFENYSLTWNLRLRIYREQGVDEMAQYPLPNPDRITITGGDFRQYVEGVIQSQGYQAGVWYYKSSRVAQVWPVWHRAFPQAKYIIVRRKTPDIINSCLKTSHMKAFSIPENRERINAETEADGWLWWIRQHDNMFRDMIDAGLNCQVVWPDRMCDGNYEQIREMLEWIGLPFDERRVREEIEPLIRR